MLNAHTRLALARACTDLLLQPDQPLRVWLRLQPGHTVATDLPGYAGLRDVFDRHATGLVDRVQLAALAAEAVVDDLDLAEPLRLERMPPRRPAGTGAACSADATAPAGMLLPAPPAGAPDADAPTLGLIDTGLPFAHLGLRPPGSNAPLTRMLALWDQDPAPDFGAWGRVPAPFGHGAVLPQPTMHTLMAAMATGTSETAVYAAAGHGSVAARRTHGAHTLGLLAMQDGCIDPALGLNDALYPDAAKAPVLGVQLARALLDSPSRAGLCGAVLDGLLWMRAVCPGRRLRVAVPYGSTLGPHDGSSLFEQALDALIDSEAGRLEVFLPMGNSYRMQLHACVPPATLTAATAGVDLVWRMPPESEAASFVELWLPPGVQGRLDVLAPDGSLVLSGLGPGDAVLHAGSDPQAAVSGVSALVEDSGGAVQQSLLLRFGPTRVSDTGRQVAEPGDWRLRLQGLAGSGTGEIHAYGSRGRGSFGSVVRAQQPRLLVPQGSPWVVQPLGSQSGMATGQRACVVGGYTANHLRSGARHLLGPARYTASGDGRNGRCADTSLASDVSASLRGVRSAGTLSAIGWRMDGSSVAVPQAVRAEVAVQPRPPTGHRDRRLGRPVVP